MENQSVTPSLINPQTRLKQIAAVVLGSLFMALCAKISIPFWPVHITMQTFGVIFLAALYGRTLAVATIGLYIFEGLCGIPVFQSFKAGPTYLMSPTGGYLLSYFICAFVVGSLSERGWGKSYLSAAGLFILGALIIDLCGLPWLIAFVGTKIALSSWISYQIPFILKTCLGTILIPLIKNKRSI